MRSSERARHFLGGRRHRSPRSLHRVRVQCATCSSVLGPDGLIVDGVAFCSTACLSHRRRSG